MFLLLNIPGKLKRITIQPGRTLKVIGTVTGPLKKYVGKNFKFKFLQNFINLFISNSGKEVLISQIRGGEDCPIKPQVQSQTGFNLSMILRFKILNLFITDPSHL